jgi:hypothetical protein
MTKGIGNVEYVRQGSEVAVLDQPFWGFIYMASTTKHQKYNIGDRVVTPDGRVFRYSLAGGTVETEFGVCVPDASITNAVAPAQVNPTSPNVLGYSPTSGQVGDRCVTITVAATDGILGTGAIAADEMRGGYIVINNGTNQHPQFRGIIGNDAVAASGGAMNVYLDGPINTIRISSTDYTGVVVGTTNIEAYYSPYANVKGMNAVNSAYVTCIGAAAARATVGQYFWVQTWGPVWLTSNGLTGEAANGRDIYINTDGSVRGQTSTTYAGYQRIGTGLDKSASNASNGPNIMLQIGI